MLVYRIEHGDPPHRGPYHYWHKRQLKDGYMDRLTDRDMTTERHPHPSKDIPEREMAKIDKENKYNSLFGFSSICQLKRWFPKIDILVPHRNGFVLAKYSVNILNLAIGRCQVTFEPEHGECMGRFDLLEELI